MSNLFRQLIRTLIAAWVMNLYIASVFGGQCTKTGSVCVQGAATKVISGASVYKDCWQYQDTYSCANGGNADTCGPLRSATGCFELASTCAEIKDGVCVRFNTTIRCDHKEPTPAGVTALNPVFTITSDTVVPSQQCQNYAQSERCKKTNSSCSGGSGTRNINGLDVYRDCWDYVDTYTCADTGSTVTDCDLYSGNNKCSLLKTNCISYTPEGSCGSRENTYKCEDTPALTKTEQVCDALSCDANGVCIKVKDNHDSDFGKSAASMEIARQMGTYLDKDTMTVFSGDQSFCSKGNLGVQSCCGSKGGAPSNSSVASAMIKNLGEGVKEVVDVGSAFVYDSVANATTQSQGFSAMATQINNWLSGSSDKAFFNGQFDPSFSYMGFSASIGGSATGSIANIALGNTNIAIEFNPYVFVATVVVNWLTQCSQQDAMTGLRKGQKLCHHVGTYCGEKFFGICIKEYESHCCYNSRLARIVQEQGRLQIEKDWGSPEFPQCKGFTQDELNQIDFAELDLSEFIAEIQQKAVNTIPGSNRASSNVTNKVNSYFSNTTTTGGGLYLPGNASGNLHPTYSGNAPIHTGIPQ